METKGIGGVGMCKMAKEKDDSKQAGVRGEKEQDMGVRKELSGVKYCKFSFLAIEFYVAFILYHCGQSFVVSASSQQWRSDWENKLDLTIVYWLEKWK